MKRVCALALMIALLLPVFALADWDCVCGQRANRGKFCGKCGRSEKDGTINTPPPVTPRPATPPPSRAPRNVYIGEHVYFGSYPQSSAGRNDPIEWIVLDKSGGSALLISAYCLDAVAFNDQLGNITWGSSGLRRWLNGTFYGTAFSRTEQACILTRTQDSDTNKKHNRNWNETTSDPVFILSSTEAAAYMPTKEERKGVLTNYAKLRGAAGQAWWWLRTAGEQWGRAANVDSKGSFDYNGSNISYTKYTVRPVIWVDTAGLE